MKRGIKAAIAALLVMTCLQITACGTATNSEPKDAAESATPAAPAAPVISDDDREATQWLQAGAYDKAIAAAERAIEHNPKDDTAYSVKGMALGLSGRTAEGLAAAQKAYALNEHNVANYYNLAMLYKLEGRRQEAETWFRRVLEKEPRNTWSLYGIATICADEGRDEEALQWLAEAIATDASVKAVATEQDHFARFKTNKTFQQLIS